MPVGTWGFWNLRFFLVPFNLDKRFTGGLYLEHHCAGDWFQLLRAPRVSDHTASHQTFENPGFHRQKSKMVNQQLSGFRHWKLGLKISRPICKSFRREHYGFGTYQFLLLPPFFVWTGLGRSDSSHQTLGFHIFNDHSMKTRLSTLLESLLAGPL